MSSVITSGFVILFLTLPAISLGSRTPSSNPLEPQDQSHAEAQEERPNHKQQIQRQQRIQDLLSNYERELEELYLAEPFEVDHDQKATQPNRVALQAFLREKIKKSRLELQRLSKLPNRNVQ